MTFERAQSSMLVTTPTVTSQANSSAPRFYKVDRMVCGIAASAIRGMTVSFASGPLSLITSERVRTSNTDGKANQILK